MRAAYYEKNGAADDVLHVGEVETPKPGPGEVRIKLKTSGVNPSDVKTRAGTARKIAFPRVIPHSDGAGEIDAVGEGVAASRVGERVWIWNGAWKRPFGTAAEYIVLPEASGRAAARRDQLRGGRLPRHSGAHRLARDRHRRHGSGMTLLIAGGAGAVAHYAIQFAKARGATVIATVSSAEKAKIARDAGADHTIDYKTRECRRARDGADQRRRRCGDRTRSHGERRAAAGRAASARHAGRLRHRPAGAVPRLVLPGEQHHGEIPAGLRADRRRAHARHRRHHAHAGGERAHPQRREDAFRSPTSSRRTRRWRAARSREMS